MIREYILLFELKVILIKDESVRAIDKLNGKKFKLWKFKLEIGLASMDL